MSLMLSTHVSDGCLEGIALSNWAWLQLPDIRCVLGNCPVAQRSLSSEISWKSGEIRVSNVVFVRMTYHCFRHAAVKSTQPPHRVSSVSLTVDVEGLESGLFY